MAPYTIHWVDYAHTVFRWLDGLLFLFEKPSPTSVFRERVHRRRRRRRRPTAYVMHARAWACRTAFPPLSLSLVQHFFFGRTEDSWNATSDKQQPRSEFSPSSLGWMLRSWHELLLWYFGTKDLAMLLFLSGGVRPSVAAMLLQGGLLAL